MFKRAIARSWNQWGPLSLVAWIVLSTIVNTVTAYIMGDSIIAVGGATLLMTSAISYIVFLVANFFTQSDGG